VRNVILIPKQQLKRMRTGLQCHLCFGLPGAEVQMIEVIGNGLIERGQFSVYQQVVMT
jgi:hypothetical protein